MMLWAGIDEAGYGPNLGPLVMTAIIAEGPDDRPPDIWADLATTVSRAGGPPDRLWVDDSKAVFKARAGRDRLDAACMAAVEASGRGRIATFGGLLDAVGAGTLADVELTPWIEADPPVWTSDTLSQPFSGASWRIVEVTTVVIGPARFNAGLARVDSKAVVHFEVFAKLLRRVWERAAGGMASVVSDKHGGRHYYAGPLTDAMPDARVDRITEGPNLSRYSITDHSRRLDLSLKPRADAGDGLVSLASLVSKSIRERWMDAFNAYWTAVIPGLKPTAGYPLDARRFREAIEPTCLRRGFEPATWWRSK